MIWFSRTFIPDVATTTQSSPFTGNSSSRKVYFQLHYTTKTFTRAQPLTSEWLPSILSHPPHYTRRFRAQNEGITPGHNMAQFFSPWGFTLRNVWSFKALHPSYSTRSFWKGLSVSNWSLFYQYPFLSLRLPCFLPLLWTHAVVCACTYKHANPRMLHSRLIHIHPLADWFCFQCKLLSTGQTLGVTGASKRPRSWTSKSNRPEQGGWFVMAYSALGRTLSHPLYVCFLLLMLDSQGCDSWLLHFKCLTFLGSLFLHIHIPQLTGC